MHGRSRMPIDPRIPTILGGWERTRLLLALVIRPLTAYPFRDGAPGVGRGGEERTACHMTPDLGYRAVIIRGACYALHVRSRSHIDKTFALLQNDA